MAGEISRENGKKGGRPIDPASEHFRSVLLKLAKEHAEELANALITKALSGDVPALKEVNDRVLGKAKQDLDVTSNGNSITLSTLSNAELEAIAGGSKG